MGSIGGIAIAIAICIGIEGSDGDGFGNASNSIQACSTPNGYVANNTDCDDSKAAVFPGATELCYGIEDDWDGQIDDNPVDGNPYYADADGDGFGDPAVSIVACSVQNGYVANNLSLIHI